MKIDCRQAVVMKRTRVKEREGGIRKSEKSKASSGRGGGW